MHKIDNASSTKDIADFWTSPEAQMYALFAKQVIPSNFFGIMVANTVVGEHLAKAGLPKTVIDFGSFKGDSSYRLYKYLTNYPAFNNVEVLGIDSVEEFVLDAQETFKEMPGMNFEYLPSMEPIIVEQQASAVTMYFVDQVIPDNDVLEYTFKKIYDAMAPGGILVMLRLSEDSFNPKLNFRFYRHNKNVENLALLNNGDPFLNHLILPLRDRTTLEIVRDETDEMFTNSLTFTDH